MIATFAEAGLHGSQGKFRRFPTGIELPDKPAYDAVTRVYNLALAALGILLLLPLLVVIAVAVKLTSRGPALYAGSRVGRAQRPFSILKFRTMQVDAEQRIGKRLVQQGEDHFTPIGRFLRRYRLDELAQLFNVLRGDMNLVGPRPMRPVFLDDHLRSVPGYAKRFLVRPGITGKAQIRGGYYTSPRHKLLYELLYIKHRSIGLDLQLIVLTFLRVMQRVFTTSVLLVWMIFILLVLPEDLRNDLTIKAGTLRINLTYVIAPLILGWHLLRRDIADRRLYALQTPVDRALLAFLVISALLIPLSRFPLDALRGLLWYLSFGAAVFLIVLNSKLVTARRDLFIVALILGTLALGGLSAPRLIEFLQAPNGHDRPLGESAKAIHLSALVVVTLPLAVARLRISREPWKRAFYAVSAVALLSLSLLVWRRTGLLCLTVALCAYFYGERRRIALAIGSAYLVLVIVLGVIEAPRYVPSAIGHEIENDLNRQAWIVGHVTPLRLAVGVGARTLPDHAQSLAGRYARSKGKTVRVGVTENTYLTLLADHGILGFASFVVFLFGGLVYMWRALPRITDAAAKNDLRATVAGLSAFAVLMATADMFYRLPVLIVFWSMMGLGLGIALMHQSGPRTYYRLVHFRHRL